MTRNLVHRLSICRFCHNVLLRPSFASRSLPKSNFSVSSKHGTKSMEEMREEDIRADIDGPAKRRVKDYSAAELKELCDISRLPRQLKAKLSHRAELLPPKDKSAATIEKQRVLYASLGEKSGLPPGVMWPSRSQIRLTIEDEKTYFATLQDMIQVVKDQEAQEKIENQKRQEEITRAMKDMPSLIAQFENKMKVKHEAEQEAMEKKTEMLEEARDFFGYAIQADDDRIVKFLEQKEAAEMEREKAERRASKQAEAKRQLEELARRATEEALRMAAKDADEKKRESEVQTREEVELSKGQVAMVVEELFKS